MNFLDILIVEDERVVALDLKFSLVGLGHRVVGLAARGEDAIRLAHQHRPDLVLMDIHLDGAMRGTEAARLIREQLGIPVVFLTAFAEDDTLLEAAAAAPYGYLLKPFELRELQAAMTMAFARRSAERGVEVAQRRLSLALEAAELGVWEWSDADRGFHVDGRTESILGGLPRTFVEAREAFLSRIDPADRPAVSELLAHGSAISRVVAARAPDGRPLWLELHARHFGGDGAGGGARVIGVIQDVTQRREMEDRLRQASVVFRTSAEGILILDEARLIVAANAAFCRLSGYTMDEVLGNDADELLHARRQSDQFFSHLSESSEHHWHGEVACRRKDGEVFPVWEHVCAVHDDEARLTHYVLAITDISAIRAAEAQMRHMAYHDALTGLGNRHMLEERLDIELQRARRSRHLLALLFIDLDGFKVINDTLGHATGDRLIQVIAGRLSAAIRRTDVAVRLGGDEFVVIAPDIDRPEDCAVLARKLLVEIAQPVQLGADMVSLTASIGIALHPDHADSVADLIMEADSAMYAAKAQGRNAYRFFSAEMSSRARERLLIEQGLRRALQTDELVLHWQPVVDLNGGLTVGLEVLVRWQHPELGLILPARFIPIAEESGLIQALGRWVLMTACRQARLWRDQGGPRLRIAINVSVCQFADEGFESGVRQALQDSGLDPASLELEITESVLQRPEQNQPVLERLRALGVNIAIDDFGTGYSSLALLRQLPVDRIKIDKSFVDDLADDPHATAITGAIVGLAQTLGYALTAEGVETAVQRERLRSMGCDDAQGWLYSRALPVDQVPAWLAGQAAVLVG
ncbi:diguanylate cyclase/phosphodiesterase with PAS/PAC sensor(s) [Sphaerotilus hippei]|uniref:Diguanylate cyclase/phosphodiesterase with PAS/PAC sensor(S) n=1 Tax=Sphaerotilus hippei TaxID=744406 RepID=A0A318H9G5_9BURK|nr:EAL domain-containing protein [Sphaerotilus hippei]PXW99568.1 diguanylate cyclase/phosphodiesterase with PAS/PAC sensor(s) [Sphaerotilus hippei]